MGCLIDKLLRHIRILERRPLGVERYGHGVLDIEIAHAESEHVFVVRREQGYCAEIAPNDIFGLGFRADVYFEFAEHVHKRSAVMQVDNASVGGGYIPYKYFRGRFFDNKRIAVER